MHKTLLLFWAATQFFQKISPTPLGHNAASQQQTQTVVKFFLSHIQQNTIFVCHTTHITRRQSDSFGLTSK